MAYNAYRVGADGKAPKGLKAEDYVITGNGTYRITGVNDDGSYRSERISNVSTDTYKGKYADAPIVEEERPEVAAPYYPKAQIAVSTPTASASVEEARLESTMPYYPKAQTPAPAATTVQTTSAAQTAAAAAPVAPVAPAAPAAPAQQTAPTQQTGNVVDLSPWLKQQAASQLEADLAGLAGAYASAMSGLQTQEDAIPYNYDAARRSAAAQDVMSRKAFQEQAAASGLNTGASGQAALSMDAAYRNILAGIDAGEAQALNDIARQRSGLAAKLEADNAAAAAKSGAALSSALYQELLRQDNQRRADEQAAAAAQAKQEAALAEQQAAAQKDARARVAEYVGNRGDLSLLDPAILAASGYTEQELKTMAAYNRILAEQDAADAVAEAKPALSWEQTQKEITAGNFTPGVQAAYEHYMKEPHISTYGKRYSDILDAVNMFVKEGVDENQILNFIDAQNVEDLSDAGVLALLKHIGAIPNDAA